MREQQLQAEKAVPFTGDEVLPSEEQSLDISDETEFQDFLDYQLFFGTRAWLCSRS